MKLSGGLSGPCAIELGNDGQMEYLVTVTGLSAKKIRVTQLQSVTQVTSENRAHLSSILGAAIGGMLLAGPIGGLVGAWLKSGAKCVAVIVLVDGTSAVAEMSPIELAQLLAAIPHAEQLRRAMEDESHRVTSWMADADVPAGPTQEEDPFAFLK